MTSEPLLSFSTHRRTVHARTTCPISFTTRCSSLSSVRPTDIDRNVRGAPFGTTRTPPGFRSDGIKHSTIANNGRIGDLYGLPVGRSNDVAPPLCGLYLLRSQTECLSIHADAAEIGSISAVVLSCTSKAGLCTDSQPVVLLFRHDLEIDDS